MYPVITTTQEISIYVHVSLVSLSLESDMHDLSINPPAPPTPPQKRIINILKDLDQDL